jgi:hypothetical protein
MVRLATHSAALATSRPPPRPVPIDLRVWAEPGEAVQAIDQLAPCVWIVARYDLGDTRRRRAWAGDVSMG